PVPSAILIHEHLRAGCEIDIDGNVRRGHYNPISSIKAALASTVLSESSPRSIGEVIRSENDNVMKDFVST
ncbi:hypothetical protein KIN20_008845, partial [Parelaphostrongylus tenuis]